MKDEAALTWPNASIIFADEQSGLSAVHHDLKYYVEAAGALWDVYMD